MKVIESVLKKYGIDESNEGIEKFRKRLQYEAKYKKTEKSIRIGQALKEAREKAKKTQADVIQELSGKYNRCPDASDLSKWENGKPQPADIISSLCDLYGLDEKELCKEEHKRNDKILIDESTESFVRNYCNCAGIGAVAMCDMDDITKDAEGTLKTIAYVLDAYISKEKEYQDGASVPLWKEICSQDFTIVFAHNMQTSSFRVITVPASEFMQRILSAYRMYRNNTSDLSSWLSGKYDHTEKNLFQLAVDAAT